MTCGEPVKAKTVRQNNYWQNDLWLQTFACFWGFSLACCLCDWRTLSTHRCSMNTFVNAYRNLLDGVYCSFDRIVIGAYFTMLHSAGGLLTWFRRLHPDKPWTRTNSCAWRAGLVGAPKRLRKPITFPFFISKRARANMSWRKPI